MLDPVQPLEYETGLFAFSLFSNIVGLFVEGYPRLNCTEMLVWGPF